MVSAVSEAQRTICARFDVAPFPVRTGAKVGVARNIADPGIQPLNGLRHASKDDMSGWYLWRGGEIPQNHPDFFVSLHVEHLGERCPDAVPYLALPPGWRFLSAPDHEDVWFNAALLSPDA